MVCYEKEIFNMFLLGMSKSEIAEKLNKRKVMTPALYKKTYNLGILNPRKIINGIMKLLIE